ncbi:mitochondrial coenzyme A diphosphatase NUDT8-like [Bicyclus anynana]|uniref:Mitochondrial coenzyme A diphosphatase NUDT8-like n=1 Tax=Bicyclus anynana TaxID=110368 RepID=A0A6J1NP56_BICAN|nr:mitochondrial coenzyme A diphosphatase NUDT8-like [Bicyclus anynana]
MSLSPEVLLSKASREKCIAKLKELPTYTTESSTNLKYKAAVLVPLFVQNGEVHILYTVRSSKLRTFSGQVVFPGGKVEGTEGVIETALRETEEEIGISANSIDIWSAMSPMQSSQKDMYITPVVGFIKDLDIKKLRPNIHEVEEIFSVPISALCDRKNQGYLLYKGQPYPLFTYGKHIIWGNAGIATCIFLNCFLPSELYQFDLLGKSFTYEELMRSKL